MNGHRQHNTPDFLLFEGLADYLQQQGFEVNPQTHLRIAGLMQKTGGKMEMEELKMLLCPLFARNKDQQEQFHAAFDRYLRLNLTPTALEKAEAGDRLPSELENLQAPDKKRFFWGGIGVAAILLLLAAMLIQLGAFDGWLKSKPKIDPEPAPTDMPPLTLDPIEIDTSGGENDVPDEPLAKQDVPVRTETADTKAANENKQPHLEHLPALEEDISDLEASCWQKFALWLFLASLIIPMVAFVTYEWYWQRKQRHSLIRRQYLKPPDVHRMELHHPKLRLFANEQFYRTANHMRRRHQTQHQKLSIPKTLKATLDAGGMATFRYDRTTRITEYLVLIETRGGSDHLARYYDQMMRELIRYEVFIEHFYYQDDPRTCWKSRTGNYLRLSDLRYRFPNHHLIVIGGGKGFLNGITGEWHKWGSLFHAWENRRLLSTTPPDGWGYTEHRLSEVFDLRAAGLEALAPPPKEHGGNGKTNPPPRETAAYTPGQGTRYGELLQACALYPELHWDLTIELCKRLFGEVPAPLLHQLCQMEWFREGAMPEDERKKLLAEIPPQTRKIALQTIVDVLKANPPGISSYANAQYQMNLVVAQHQLAEKPEEKQRTKQQIKELAQNGETREYATLNYGEVMDELALPLPRALKNIFFGRRQAAINTNRPLRLAALALCLLLLCAAFWWLQPQGEVREHAGKSYWLKNNKDHSRYWLHIANNAAPDSLKLEYYDDAISDDSNNYKARYNRAATRLGQEGEGDWQQSVKELLQLDSLLAANAPQPPDSAAQHLRDSILTMGRYNLGVAHYRLRQYQKAEQHWQAYNQRLANIASAEGTATEGGKANPPRTDAEGRGVYALALTRWQRALAEQNDAALPNAIASFDSLLTLYPGYIDRKHELIGFLQPLYTSQPKLRPPLAAFFEKCGVPIDSLDIIVANNMLRTEAATALQKGRLAAALRLYRQLQGQMPNDSLAAKGLAAAQEQMDQTRKQMETALRQADANFAGKKFADAKAAYEKLLPTAQNALEDKALTAQLQQKIADSDTGIAQSSAEEKQREFDRIMEKADALLLKNDHAAAKAEYQKLEELCTSTNPNTPEQIKNKETEVKAKIKLCNELAELQNLQNQADRQLNENKCYDAQGTIDKITRIATPWLENDVRAQMILVDIDYSKYTPEAIKQQFQNTQKANAQALASCTAAIRDALTTEVSRPASSNLPAPIQELMDNMVYIPSGTFTMGCTPEQGEDCYNSAKPAHSVTLSSYQIGKYEVTQAQWRAVMGSNPPELGFPECDDCPVERVSWNDVQDFLAALNKKTGNSFRLPTEAEWEYAARGGKNGGTKYAGGNNIDAVAWYYGNSNGKTHPVGQQQANALGLYDMSGNVYEWCDDWYANDYYANSPKNDPKGPATGNFRVLRGGSWGNVAERCRTANRGSNGPNNRDDDCGFRLCR